MLVQVAIDLALDRLFTYEVPVALEEKLAVGQLLSVPFGHREARGFAIEVAAASAAGGLTAQAPAKPSRPSRPSSRSSQESLRLKPITAILDETPFFSPPLLDLVRRVAHETASPLEAVLKAALPASVLKRNAHQKERLYVAVVPDAPETPLSARQKTLYENVRRLDGGWMQFLCRDLKTTPASLRTLAAKGLLTVAPRAMRRNPLAAHRILPSRPLPLNAEQDAALKALLAGDASKPYLLFGVTGSGKTEVYLQAIAHELAAGRGAIVLVPEIALTPQTVRRFASRFGEAVAVLHSALSDGERYDEWHRIRSGEARVVVGPRSAVWAPVRNLGLIVVDEEHEPSYKQDECPRYHARDVAVWRGAAQGAKVVLGSATPSLETWAAAKGGRVRPLVLKERAGLGSLPAVHLVDMRDSALIFSPELLSAISLRLNRHEQTILFLNRRGFARQVVCESCGHVLACPNCSSLDRPMPYTFHAEGRCLRCHICGGWILMPPSCPVCGGKSLSTKGLGTQRAEAALKSCFGAARILRMDADSTTHKSSHDEILGAFRRGEADILVGTQMIAKGLDFPSVTLVGVLQADASLNVPDFRAAERTFQLLAQVSGRAGRAELPGEVFIQTRDGANKVLEAAARADFESFAEDELRERRELFLPPFCRLAVVQLKAKDASLVESWAAMYAKSLQNYAASLAKRTGMKDLLAGEAVPSALEKADGLFRWQILLRAASSESVLRAWKWLLKVRPPASGLKAALDMDAVRLT